MDSMKHTTAKLRVWLTAAVLASAVALPAAGQEIPDTPEAPAAATEQREESGNTLPVATGSLERALTEHSAAGGILVAVVAILMVFGAPAVAVVLLVYFLLRYRERRQKLLNETIQRFLDAGKDVPEEVLQHQSRESTPAQHLHQGILLLGLGIGLSVFLSLMADLAVGSLGLILITMGIAKVIIWKLASRSTSPQD